MNAPTIGSLFSGIGGLDLGVERASGGRVIWQCEQNPFCRDVLARHWPEVPCYDDAVGLDAPPCDVLIGGFPCQDLSDASRGRGDGLDGQRSGLWYEMLRIIRGTRPPIAFIENVAGAAWRRWLPHVRRDLWAAGYASVPVLLSAAAVGAPFAGDRVFVAAADRDSESVGALNGQVAFMQAAPGVVRQDWGEAPTQSSGSG